MSFAKVAEYQKRGLIHCHADGPEGGTETPPEKATTEVLIKAVRAAAKAVTVTLQDDETLAGGSSASR